VPGPPRSPPAEPPGAPAAPFLHRVGGSTANLTSLRPERRALRWGLYAGLAVVAAGSITVVIVSQFDQVSAVDLRLAPGWLAAAVLVFGLLQLAHAELWRVVLHQLGYAIDLRRGLPIWNATVLARYVPTSLLTPIMRAALAEPAGVPRRVSLIYLALVRPVSVAVAVAVAVRLVQLGLELLFATVSLGPAAPPVRP